MSSVNNDMKHLLNGRKYAPVSEFPTRPECAVLIEADRYAPVSEFPTRPECAVLIEAGGGIFRIYTIEEYKGKVLNMLLRETDRNGRWSYGNIAVDPIRSNI